MKLNIGVNGMDGPGGSGWRGGQLAQSAPADTPAIFARARRMVLPLFAVACLLLAFVPAALAADRSVVITSMTLTRGATNCVPIALMAAGDENSVSFSVCFDTNALRYVTARRIGAALEFGATAIINSNFRTNGRIGFIIGLTPGVEPEAFPAGSNGLVEICFASLQTAPASTTVTICDSPIQRDVVDPLAEPLVADWLDGTMTIPGGCSYSLSTNAASFAAAGGNGGFDLTSDTGCTWTVTNPSSWIIMTSPTIGTNSRPMSYFVEENTGASSRTGIVTVAGQTHTVVQAGSSCSFSFSPGNRNHGHGATTGSVSLTTGPACAWTTVNTNTWLTVTNPTGTGTGFVYFVVEANPTINTRVGFVSIDSASFSVTQFGIPCTFDLSDQDRSHGHGASTGLVTFITIAGCEWTVVKDVSWITLTSPTSGSGNGFLGYNIDANPDIGSRIGTISVRGEDSTNVFTITQAGQGCAISLSPAAGRSHGFGSTTNDVDVETAVGCPWVASTTNDWITLTGITNGTANASVPYLIAANTTFSYRTGVIAVADQVFPIVQDPATCSYTLSPGGKSHGNGANANSFEVRAPVACAWMVFNTNSWITLTGVTNSSGSNTVNYSFTANTVPETRIGVITITDAALNAAGFFTVTQAAATCNYTLSAGAP